MVISTFLNHIIDNKHRAAGTIPECAKFCLEHGITGIDAMIFPHNTDSIDEVRILEREGMHLNSLPVHWDILHGANMATGCHIVDTASRLGAPNILLIPGLFRPEDDRAALMERSLEPLADFCRRATERGITVGMEDFDTATSPVVSTEGLLYYLTHIPELACTFDTGNALFNDEDALEAFHTLRPYIRTQIHCKDRRWVAKRPDEPYLTTTGGNKLYGEMVGRGIVPIAEILRELRDSGFEGSATLEQFGAAEPLPYLAEAAKFALGALAE